MSFLICPLEITICAVQWPWLLSVITLHYTNNLKLTGYLLEGGIKQPSLDTPAHDYMTNVCGPTCALQMTIWEAVLLEKVYAQ